jgi:hypothetical protein
VGFSDRVFHLSRGTSRRTGHGVHRFGDGRVSLAGRVLVPERGLRRDVPEPAHQLLDAGGGGQRPGDVAKVIEMEMVESETPAGRLHSVCRT